MFETLEQSCTVIKENSAYFLEFCIEQSQAAMSASVDNAIADKQQNERKATYVQRD